MNVLDCSAGRPAAIRKCTEVKRSDVDAEAKEREARNLESSWFTLPITRGPSASSTSKRFFFNQPACSLSWLGEGQRPLVDSEQREVSADEQLLGSLIVSGQCAVRRVYHWRPQPRAYPS